MNRKHLLGDGMALSFVRKSDRSLPPVLRDVLKVTHPAQNHVIVLNLNVSGDEENSERLAIKRFLFDALKANGKVKSQGLWLGENKEGGLLIAYLEANQQSLMAMTESGIINAALEASLRQEYMKEIGSKLEGGLSHERK